MSAEVVGTLVDAGGLLAFTIVMWLEMRSQTRVLRAMEKCLAVLVDRSLPPKEREPTVPNLRRISSAGDDE